MSFDLIRRGAFWLGGQGRFSDPAWFWNPSELEKIRSGKFGGKLEASIKWKNHLPHVIEFAKDRGLEEMGFTPEQVEAAFYLNVAEQDLDSLRVLEAKRQPPLTLVGKDEFHGSLEHSKHTGVFTEFENKKVQVAKLREDYEGLFAKGWEEISEESRASWREGAAERDKLGSLDESSTIYEDLGFKD